MIRFRSLRILSAQFRAKAKYLLRGIRLLLFPKPYLWETLSNAPLCSEAGQYPEARTALVDLVRGAPCRLIDLGCGNGATAAFAKERFPSAEIIGIEQDPAAAKLAAERLDRVVTASIESFDYDANGVPKGSIDVAFLLDVLEHLYNPWAVLRSLRPRLTAQGQVIASIPNIRNYWLLSRLVSNGEFSYAPNGLMDITHIRFFTRSEIERMFAETGYRINSLTSFLDDRVPESPFVSSEQAEKEKFGLRNLTAADAMELRTLQFYVVATPD